MLEVGDRPSTHGRTITEADLVSFAALTGDWHPQHADAEWAAESRFGERIAHGMLVLSYVVGLAGFDPERVVALRGFDSVTFKRPVAIGDTIRVEAEVEDAAAARRRPRAARRSRWRVAGERGRLAVRAQGRRSSSRRRSPGQQTRTAAPTTSTRSRCLL